MQIRVRGELYKLLDEFSLPRIVAEVCCAEGRFSKEMYDWGVERLYLVDLFESMPFIEGCASFDDSWHLENYKKVVSQFGDKPNVTILKGFSHKMAECVPDESLGLVYVDGDHRYDGVKTDIRFWWPKLAPGGIMAFHDFHDEGGYGVKRAVVEFMKGERGINIIQEDGKLENIGAWIRK